MSIDALIFDFDGTLLDTETLDFTVLSEQYRAHGSELAVARWVMGLGTVGGFDAYGELEQLASIVVDREALSNQHRQRYLELCAKQELLAGVRELLAEGQARGLKMAVASSSTRSWVEGWVTRHEIGHYFSCIRTRDDVQRVKPAPDLFLSAAACLGVEPQRCVVFEDSINGIRAASAAGMRCIATPIALLGDSEIEIPPAWLRLRSLAELPAAELLDRLIATEQV